MPIPIVPIPTPLRPTPTPSTPRRYARPIIVVPRCAPRERSIEVLEEDDASRGDAAHEGGERGVVDPGGGEGDYVDVEGECAGEGVDEGGFAGAGDSVEKVASSEGDASCRVPFLGLCNETKEAKRWIRLD